MKKITRKFEVVPLTELPKNIVPAGSPKLPEPKMKKEVRGKPNNGTAQPVRAIPKKSGK